MRLRWPCGSLRRDAAARRARAAAVESLRQTYDRALRANDSAFQMAQDRLAVEQLIYERAALGMPLPRAAA